MTSSPILKVAESRLMCKRLEIDSDGVLETAVSARDSLETGFSMSRSRLGLEKSLDSITETI